LLHLVHNASDGVRAGPGPVDAIGTLATPVTARGWPDALAAQIQWMAGRQIHSATLRLSPEHLGPLEIRIDLMRSQINVSFSAHHADTRDALAQAVPRLRELFGASGLTLGEATVQQQSSSSAHSKPSNAPNATPSSETVEPVANTAVHSLGLIDEYV
jgi:flagellar hook-length control protein FliK